jgi:hypothetical protein
MRFIRRLLGIRREYECPCGHLLWNHPLQARCAVPRCRCEAYRGEPYRSAA